MGQVVNDPEPDYDAIVRGGVLPTFGATPELLTPTVPLDRERLDRLHAAWDAAMERWLDHSAPDGSAESAELKGAADAHCRAFIRAFIASVPIGTRLRFAGDGPREYWHNGDGVERLQCRRLAVGS